MNNLWKHEKKKQIREELTWCHLVFLLLYENKNKVKKKEKKKSPDWLKFAILNNFQYGLQSNLI